MVVGAFDGARVASELQNPGVNLYRVLFEEHEDGARRRARLHTYELNATSNGASFVPFMGYAVGGQLRRRPVTPAPPRGTSVGHGPGATTGGAIRGTTGPTSARSSRRRDRSRAAG
jgi:hypothetical protein